MARTNEIEQEMAALEAILNRGDGSGAGSGLVWVSFPISDNPCPPEALVRLWLAECGITPSELVLVVGSHGKRAALVIDYSNLHALFPEGWGLVEGEGRSSTLSGWVHPRFLAVYRRWLDDRRTQRLMREGGSADVEAPNTCPKLLPIKDLR